MNIKLELPQLTDLKPRLTVIGVGGAAAATAAEARR